MNKTKIAILFLLPVTIVQLSYFFMLARTPYLIKSVNGDSMDLCGYVIINTNVTDYNAGEIYVYEWDEDINAIHRILFSNGTHSWFKGDNNKYMDEKNPVPHSKILARLEYGIHCNK